MNGASILALLLTATLCGSCKKGQDAPVLTGSHIGEPTEAQTKLPTMKLWVGPEELTVELAATAQQQQIGMMFRTNLAENAGMLFPLAFTQRASFWMKNCPLPLSAAYINPEGVIEDIRDLQPHNTNAVVSTSDNIRFVLESPHGWFQRHNIRTGMIVRTERGSLMETFFHKR